MKIDHIGVAVEELQSSLSFYRDALGLEFKGQERVEDQGVEVAMLDLGESKLELLEPLSDESPIARHLAKRGEGIHHLAIKVEDIEAKMAEMEDAGVEFIGEEPTPGAGGKKIIFAHPKSTSGVLLELCEEQ